jgi:hypothetical protein
MHSVSLKKNPSPRGNMRAIKDELQYHKKGGRRSLNPFLHIVQLRLPEIMSPEVGGHARMCASDMVVEL